ncbi:hypothetical protein PMAA_093660 [Talaromyces marneffei ATCC 18224]|uniref:Uncharacterized protein n=1 Tax=Talaromyces marneffei (strain ATCC 18224 / CBS 334.59 / QM 7333) TaxID=441960 RepID=B6QHA5_TALMQ|nr:hypothetical protein PMAA_093660 [Talaromyces marneffei ATCC 18224]
MSVSKYTEPIPTGAIIMETWEQVKGLSIANPLSGLMGDIGEAHYPQDHEGVILGVASDELCLEIDARISSVMRAIEARTEMGEEDGTRLALREISSLKTYFDEIEETNGDGRGSFSFSFRFSFDDGGPDAIIRFPKPGHTATLIGTKRLQTRSRSWKKVWLERCATDEFLALYEPRLAQFLRALEQVEKETALECEQSSGPALSTRMRYSWATGRF